MKVQSVRPELFAFFIMFWTREFCFFRSVSLERILSTFVKVN
jgi:hypothetical protein